MEEIKVLGSGCTKCKMLFDNAKKAAAMSTKPVSVEYVDDIDKILDFGIMVTPALVINKKVVAAGKVLSAQKILEMLN
ncbi:MAG: hypothetical protein B6D62_03680 [Candidatus Cloacimonas sp. 4484_275]|nr:MAG: hypothetical protein B6D62_03680 [Candidatus Cloacimonas sp. 4484_275]RLC51771.1 MAG: thioredoxin family protein [Candidatus Cloacimonadota bacterium]